MMCATSFSPQAWERRRVHLSRLVDRIENAMRPLASGRHGADHERVRELYTYLQALGSGDALTRARRAVLYEMLTPVVYRHPERPSGGADVPHHEDETDTAQGPEELPLIL